MEFEQKVLEESVVLNRCFITVVLIYLVVAFTSDFANILLAVLWACGQEYCFCSNAAA